MVKAISLLRIESSDMPGDRERKRIVSSGNKIAPSAETGSQQ